MTCTGLKVWTHSEVSEKNTVSVDFPGQDILSSVFYFKILIFNQPWVLSGFNEYETSMLLHVCEANIVTINCSIFLPVTFLTNNSSNYKKTNKQTNFINTLGEAII